ncbi:hypothetical protein BH09PSE5_BH09PSE5_07200 [soil metagenome]
MKFTRLLEHRHALFHGYATARLLVAASLVTIAALVALLMPVAASADDGHDHGDAPAAPAGVALPRFTAASDLFELVGVVNGKSLTLYLDHSADNSPVKDATLQLEVGGQKVAARSHGEGEFEADLAQPLATGVTSITATVTTPAASDLLAGEIDLHEEAHVDEPATMPGWQRTALWAAGAIVVLALLTWLMRRSTASRQSRVGGAA